MVQRHLLQDVLKELYAPVLFTMPSLTNNDNLSADGLFAFLSGLRTQVLPQRGRRSAVRARCVQTAAIELVICQPSEAPGPSSPVAEAASDHIQPRALMQA